MKEYTKTTRVKEPKARTEKPKKKKIKKATMTQVRKKCVALAKKIAKHRDKYRCRRCWKLTSGHDRQWSHVIAESRDKRLSCDPRNIKVLCYSCHVRWHECPTESGERYKITFPEDRAYLDNMHKTIDSSLWVEFFQGELITLQGIAKAQGIELK